jgi:hypothetical protein
MPLGASGDGGDHADGRYGGMTMIGLAAMSFDSGLRPGSGRGESGTPCKAPLILSEVEGYGRGGRCP